MALTISFSSGCLEDQLILPCESDPFPQTYFLPDEVDLVNNERISVESEEGDNHSQVRIDIYPEHTLVSVYGDCDTAVSISSTSLHDIPFYVPASSTTNQKSIVLRVGDAVLTPNGRWTFRRSTEESQVVPGAIMAPPPLYRREIEKTSPGPHIVESPIGAALVDDETLLEELLGPSTTLSPGRERSVLAELHQNVIDNCDGKATPPPAKRSQTEPETVTEYPNQDTAGDKPDIAESESQTPKKEDLSLMGMCSKGNGGQQNLKPKSRLVFLGNTMKQAQEQTEEGSDKQAPEFFFSTDGGQQNLRSRAHGIPVRDFAHVEGGPECVEHSEQAHVDQVDATSPTDELECEDITSCPPVSDHCDASTMANDEEDDVITVKPRVETQHKAVQANVSPTGASLLHPGSELAHPEVLSSPDNLSNELPAESQQGLRWLPGKPGPKSTKEKRRRSLTTHSNDTPSETRPKKRARRSKSRSVSFAAADATPAPATTPRSSNTSQASSANSTKLSTPRRSGRRPASARVIADETSIADPPIIMFSSTTKVEEKKTVMRAFRASGGQVAKSINDATMLCVGDTGLKKTPKFLAAILRGLDIVTETWLAEAYRNDKFPDPQSFFPKDREKEKEWNFNLADAVQRGKQSMMDILAPYTVYCSEQHKEEMQSKGLWKDYSQIITALEVQHVKTGLPPVGADPTTTVLIGASNDACLVEAQRRGFRMYTQDLITMAVLRGVIELASNEFLMEVPVKDEPVD